MRVWRQYTGLIQIHIIVFSGCDVAFMGRIGIGIVFIFSMFLVCSLVCFPL